MNTDRTVEEYLKDLVSINEQLQRDDVPMDEALRLYRDGAVIAERAHRLLKSYEKEIELIEQEALSDSE